MKLPTWKFWYELAGKDGQYNDLQYLVLRANGYSGSNPDMLAAWAKEGYPELSPAGDDDTLVFRAGVDGSMSGYAWNIGEILQPFDIAPLALCVFHDNAFKLGFQADDVDILGRVVINQGTTYLTDEATIYTEPGITQYNWTAEAPYEFQDGVEYTIVLR